jgi:hypothetical protein
MAFHWHFMTFAVKQTGGLIILWLADVEVKVFIISGPEFFGMPLTVPSSSTPMKICPPKRFKKEQADSSAHRFSEREDHFHFSFSVIVIPLSFLEILLKC